MLMSFHHMQAQELQQLAAAAADLQAAKDTEPSSPAPKEITPPKPWEAAARGAPMLRRVPGASAEDDPAAVRLARALAACVEGLEDELNARRAAIRSSPADLPPAPKV